MSQTVVGNISLIYHNISWYIPMLAACNVSKWCLNFDLSPVSLGSVMLGLGCRISLQGYCRRHITKIHQETREWHIYNHIYNHIYIYNHIHILYICIYILLCWFLSIHDMILYGIVLTYVISQHHQTHTQGLELPQDRQGLPHDLRSWFIHFSFPYTIMFENSPPKQEETRGCMTTGRFLAA